MAGRSWEHGTGVLPDIPKPGPKPNPEPAGPKPVRDVYFGPFDECAKHSSHTVGCSKMFTCQLFLILSILTLKLSYSFERLQPVKNYFGLKKQKIIVGCVWILTAIFMVTVLALFDSFIRKDNAAFFREETDGHNFDDIVTWKHGEAYTFGWVGASLNVVAGVMFIVLGHKFY